MKKEALDLLRKYIDLQIALEVKCEHAATKDYYDESIPWTHREIEAAWKAFTDALGKENEDETGQGTRRAGSKSIGMASIITQALA